MGLRLGQRQRPLMRGNVADQAFADPQPGAMHRRGIEALGGEQLEHLAGPHHVDRADLGHHLGCDHAHDVVEALLRCTRTRHRIPEPLEEHSRPGDRSHALHGQATLIQARLTIDL